MNRGGGSRRAEEQKQEVTKVSIAGIFQEKELEEEYQYEQNYQEYEEDE